MGLYLTYSLVALLILGSIQYYFYHRISFYLRSTSRPPWLRMTNAILFATFNLLLLLAMLFRAVLSRLPEWAIDAAVYPLYVWQFSFFVLFLVAVAGAVLKAPFLLVRWVMKRFHTSRTLIDRMEQDQSFRTFNARRRELMRQGVTIVGGLALGSSAYGALRRNDYDVTTMAVPIKGLPEAFDGFSIGFVSDVHSSMFMDVEQMSQYVNAVNELHPDAIVVTGDFVNSMYDEVFPFAEAFSRLRAPHGVYGVLGNHDYYTRNVEGVAREVNSAGIKLLRNERVEIENRGRRLQLLGIDDVGTPRRAALLMDRTMAGAEPGDPRILLCHRPYFFPEAAARNIALTLSGHTHGGQVVFLKLGNDVIAPARIASPYVAGMYTLGRAQMYVSRGLGTVGIPIRINCPPEVTKLVLTRDGRS